MFEDKRIKTIFGWIEISRIIASWHNGIREISRKVYQRIEQYRILKSNQRRLLILLSHLLKFL